MEAGKVKGNPESLAEVFALIPPSDHQTVVCNDYKVFGAAHG
jgi:hypothetical protein